MPFWWGRYFGVVQMTSITSKTDKIDMKYGSNRANRPFKRPKAPPYHSASAINILPLRLELTSSTWITRKLTSSYLIFEVFGGCPRVSKRIHNSISRSVRHKHWAQAAMDVRIVTLESAYQSVDRPLTKKSHCMVNHTSTSNPRIRCWGQFGWIWSVKTCA